MNGPTQPELSRLEVRGWPIASFAREELAALTKALTPWSVNALVLQTCQRLELYRLDSCGIGGGEVLTGRQALLHLAEVAAGLHSVVLGEEQVLGQVRGALAAAPLELRTVLGKSIAVARVFRREAGLHSDSGVLLDAALAAGEVMPVGNLLVIGAGAVGRLVARRGLELGFDAVTVASRLQPYWLDERDERMAYIPLNQLRTAPAADVVVTCLAAEAGELVAGCDLPLARRLYVDFGTPRNINPKTDAPLVNLAELSAKITQPTAERESLQARLANLLDRHLNQVGADSMTALGALRLEIESVRRTEIDRSRRLHPEFSEQALEDITRSLVNQLFHRPTTRLKDLDDPVFARRLLDLFQDDR